MNPRTWVSYRNVQRGAQIARMHPDRKSGLTKNGKVAPKKLAFLGLQIFLAGLLGVCAEGFVELCFLLGG